VFTSYTSGKPEFREITVGSSAETTIFADRQDNHVDDWTPDGRAILYHIHVGDGQVQNYSLPLSGERKPTLSGRLGARMQVSPDGNWVAYSSTESGRSEIKLAAFPGFSDRRTVSTTGGSHPWWREDGKELFYLDRDSKMMSLDVKSGGASPARSLFQTGLRYVVGSRYQPYSVTPDGQRFLVIERPQIVNDPPLHVIVNWPAALAR
jgi:serine/threonine-protein kinase